MKWTKLIIFNLIVFAVLFIGLEIAFRILNPDYQYYEQTVWNEFEKKAIEQMDTNWVQVDPDLGWVARTDKPLKFYRAAFDSVKYTINAQGFRNSTDFDSLTTKQKKRILLLGDSFVFGILQEDSARLCRQLSTDLKNEFEVYNLAIPGWGLDQMYLALKKYSKLIEPDIVVLNLIDDDLTRVAESFYWGASTKPSFRVEDGQLTLRGKDEGRLNAVQKFFFFQSKLLNHLYFKYTMWQTEPVVELLIRSIIRDVKYSSGEILIFRHPRIEQLEQKVGPPEMLPQSYLMKPEISYFDMKDTLRQLSATEIRSFFIPGDGHWSKEGIEVMSEILAEKIKCLEK